MKIIVNNKKFSSEEISILKSFIGRKLIRIRHEEPFHGNALINIVEFVFDDSSAYLISDLVHMDYYGDEDVIPCIHMYKGENPYPDAVLIDNAVSTTIRTITIVTDSVKATRNDKSASYEISLVEGLIIEFTDGLQIAFVRHDDFLEAVDFYKGYNLIDRFRPTEDLIEGLKEDFTASVERTIETIS